MEGEQTHRITTAQAVGWPFQCGFRAVSKQFRSGFAIAFYRKTARVTPRLFCAVFRVHYRQNASSFFISFITKCSYGALSEQYSNSFTGRFPPPISERLNSKVCDLKQAIPVPIQKWLNRFRSRGIGVENLFWLGNSTLEGTASIGSM